MDWSAKIPNCQNFIWGEFFVTTHDQELLRREFLLLPAATQILYKQNILCLANRLQALRDFLGGPMITITSGWRSKRVNDLVTNAKKSYHLYGMAADIKVAGVSPQHVQELLKGWSGGLGLNPDFTHLDMRDKPVKFTY